MATLYVTEFSNVAYIGLGLVPVAPMPATATQTVAITTATASSAFNAATKLIRVHADAICSVKIGGTAPVATTSDMRMAANQTEYFVVVPGDKLSVITNT